MRAPAKLVTLPYTSQLAGNRFPISIRGLEFLGETTYRVKSRVIIPADSEAHGVPRVIAKMLPSAPQADILVIADGSGDGTLIVPIWGMFVVRPPCDPGIGAAAQTGYTFRDEIEHDFRLRADADPQREPAEILALTSICLESDAHVAER